MISNVTFTGVQKQIRTFMSEAAHEYMPVGKIFDKAEAAATEKLAKVSVKADEIVTEVPFFNHRGDNVIDETVAKLHDLEAANSYARSHGVHITE